MMFRYLTLTLLVVAWHSVASNISIRTSNLDEEQQQKVESWLQQGLQAVETTLAPIPQPAIDIRVKGASEAMEPVPWGQIIRNSPIQVLLYVNPRMPLTAFIDDWTLYHELSHLYFPYLDYPSFWLSEGFATYLQYLAMYQGRIIDRSQFVERIQQGLLRGMHTTRDKPGRLSDVSADMWQTKAFKRVYWSGAAFFMEADLQLIEQGQDLTELVATFSHCCLTEQMTGQELVRTLDVISDTEIFSQLFATYRYRRDFPDISARQLHILASHYH
ncbi:M1 family metallopeptidase [Thalassotalea mangrovi]|uniref:M1 family metallopeptidase n=1 Tax=Thalassotalea mangrovi TaxID=2572245 RepID=A0A4U1B5U5_9GAMM|nr:M1 family metallopeptidase [Thalassotalea mangrovi]TKB45862.1 M1 family metallopeptidase [Thalassotalea mangrovi]